MSKFFKALEQAERDRENRETAPIELPPSAAVPDLPATPRSPVDSPAVARPTPRPMNGLEEHLVTLLTPLAPAAEEYRRLRSILEEKADGRHLVVAISSPAKGDGKTLTTVNLAGALCQGAPKEVLLVDADLRNPSLPRVLGILERHPGLSDAVRDHGLDLSSLVYTTRFPHLSLLSAGRSSAAPYEVLQSSRIAELIDEARRRFDYVIIDTPPMVSLSDCRLIEKWVDGFLVVVAANGTPRKLVEEALRIADPGKVLGFVFNKSNEPAGRYYYYGYGYGHGNGHTPGKAPHSNRSFWSSLLGRRRLVS